MGTLSEKGALTASVIKYVTAKNLSNILFSKQTTNEISLVDKHKQSMIPLEQSADHHHLEEQLLRLDTGDKGCTISKLFSKHLM